MAERSEVATSGFKVRPLSKREAGAGSQEPEVSEIQTPPLTTKASKHSRLRELTSELRELETKLRLGGGPERVD